MIREIPYQDPQHFFSFFHDRPGTVFLDSALSMPGCGVYSYIGVDPYTIIQSKNGNNGNPFDLLHQELLKFQEEALPDIPPFQGGAVGYFGYELHQHLENIPFSKNDDMEFPDMMIGLYDLIISFDNQQQRAWIVSTGFPEKEKVSRLKRAEKRLENLLSECSEAIWHPGTFSEKGTGCQIAPQRKTCWGTSGMTAQFPHCELFSQNSNFTQAQYQQSVQKVRDYILSGDIFQANISQRFHLPKTMSPFDIYSQLRKINPAPFSAYLNFNDIVIASASPERFLKLQDRQVETRPIKGTRPRGNNAVEDKKFADELLQSKKDHAENTMIVDLMRNDLSRVCEKNSIKVSQLCGLESYATVHHLVSVVEGKLNPKAHAIDLLRATFPGGSVTGAPKIRAMEIIAEIEPTQRGPYCGAIGYIGFDGSMDTSITIRTYCIKDNIITFQTGGAIVLDSDPLKEYEETLTKAKALIKAYDTNHR